MDVTVTIPDEMIDLVRLAYGHEGLQVPEPADAKDWAALLAEALSYRWSEEVSSVVLAHKTRTAVAEAQESVRAEHLAAEPVVRPDKVEVLLVADVIAAEEAAAAEAAALEAEALE